MSKRGNINAIVKNEANGQMFRVKALHEGIYVLAPVQEIVLEDGQKEYPDIQDAAVWTMKKEVFEIICKVVVEAPPVALNEEDIAVSEGRLFVCGEPVECGTLHIVEVAAVIPTGAILRVRSKDGKGIDLKFYDVDGDIFHDMTSGKDEAQLVYQDEAVTAFLVLKKDQVKLPADEEDEEDAEDITATAVDRSLRFYEGWRGIKMIPNVYGDLTDRRKDGDADVLLFTTDDGLKDVYDVYGDRVMVEDDETAGTETRMVKVVISRDDDRKVQIGAPVFRTFHGRVLETMYGADGNYVFVTDRDAIVNTNIVGTFYRTAVGRDVVKAVQGHPVPVSVNVPDGNRAKTIFIFATEDGANVCRITVEKTRDRGFVTKIEEI